VPLDKIAMCNQKECVICGKKYTPYRIWQKVCSEPCRKKYESKKYKKSILNDPCGGKQLSTSKIGDISELEMSAYYLRNGYEVFRNVSSDGIVDLVVWNKEENFVHLIDIKTYSYSTDPEKIDNYIKNNTKHDDVKIIPYNLIERKVYKEIE
jgi:hypothetical protein